MNEEISPEGKRPFISIILTIGQYHHLAPLTLESIVSQTEQDFEIIVVETGSTKHDLQMIKQYSESIKKVFSTTSNNLAHMFNRGLALATGEYIQFLTPGEVFISDSSLALTVEQIKSQKNPDLFITSFLRRNGLAQPEVVHRSCSSDTLKRAQIPSRLACCFFKVEVLQKVKGFSKEFSRREGYELFCRIMSSYHPRIGFFRRVIMDHELQRKSPKEVLFYIYETLKIIKKYFGFWSALKWIFIYDHCRTIVWLYRSIVQYFQKSS